MLHLKVAQQISEGYLVKTGQWQDNEYLIGSIDDFVVITFRGTETFNPKRDKGRWFDKITSMCADVLTDIRAIPWKDSRIGWGHAGFLKAARGIVDVSLSGVPFKKEKVICAGHSLGGALAREAAQFLMSKGVNVVEVVDFGSPRSHIGRVAYPVRTTSYRYDDDIVTTVPPGILFKYKHPYEVDQGILVQFGGRFEADSVNLKDHSMSEYLEALK